MKVITTKSDVLKCINAEKYPNIKLYRYFGNVDYAIKAIAEDALYFSMSDTFNDPFDCMICFQCKTFHLLLKSRGVHEYAEYRL